MDPLFRFQIQKIHGNQKNHEKKMKTPPPRIVAPVSKLVQTFRKLCPNFCPNFLKKNEEKTIAVV
jgi:hypothetical protein